jgi:hypothetical protein
LPEAVPTFQVGLLANFDPPEPIEVEMPKDFTLERCYRYDRESDEEWDEANVHLLAALGTFNEPFVPVYIPRTHDGYFWAKLPTIEKVELETGEQLHSDQIWVETLTCVKSLMATVHTSDGRVFTSPICMAIRPPKDASSWSSADVLVTPEAQDRLNTEHIWHHLGGWNEDGDTYDTQLVDFERELDRFWADLIGPDEQLRRKHPRGPGSHHACLAIRQGIRRRCRPHPIRGRQREEHHACTSPSLGHRPLPMTTGQKEPTRCARDDCSTFGWHAHRPRRAISGTRMEVKTMAWRPSEYLIDGELDNTTPGKVTGWMQFAGMQEKVTFDLNGNFHRDIRGAKIYLKGRLSRR